LGAKVTGVGGGIPKLKLEKTSIVVDALGRALAGTAGTAG
jgi:hypothetical protein